MGFTAHSFFNSFNGLVSVHYRILSQCFFCYECPRVFAKIGKQLAWGILHPDPSGEGGRKWFPIGLISFCLHWPV
ncbi:hypothetical protein, partial [Veillonella atypica]|uniref:hypothetical protein n=1 Tax=Veillonella atypica TaxID=39777 RepID=UPI001D069A4A